MEEKKEKEAKILGSFTLNDKSYNWELKGPEEIFYKIFKLLFCFFVLAQLCLWGAHWIMIEYLKYFGATR